MMTDPIGDFLTRIKNAHHSKHKKVVCPSSTLKTRIAELLKTEGYISGFDVAEQQGKGKVLTLELKYDAKQAPMIEGVRRISKPGLRVYKRAGDLPEVRGGLGMAVVSTSKGVMTDADARRNNIGGEVLCYVW
jgi:small subunit ribosomal protein S8